MSLRTKRYSHSIIYSTKYALTPSAIPCTFCSTGKDIADVRILKSIIEGIGLDGTKVLRSIQHKSIADYQLRIDSNMLDL